MSELNKELVDRVQNLISSGMHPDEVLNQLGEYFNPKPLIEAIAAAVSAHYPDGLSWGSSVTTETAEKVAEKAKLYELVLARFQEGSEPAVIFNLYSPFYSEELLTMVILEAEKELEKGGDIIWRDPPSLDGRQLKFNWYLGPKESSHRWNRFIVGLQNEGHIGEETLDDLNKSTTQILNYMPNPKAFGSSFSSRGLVMGHVQSGKTTNFLGLMSKAADEGYRLIIVLSGVTNNLRSQTQERLEASIDPGQWYLLTSIESDFQRNKANAQVLLSNGAQKNIAVVKKNKSRLVSLYKWLESASAATRKALPVLIIDDECDQATVNAGTKEKRNAINNALMNILDPTFLPKNSYVGYSATPFANILADTTDVGGIYPKDFVVSLKASPGYFGAAKLFGTDMLDGDEDSPQAADIVRNIPESEADKVCPPKKRADAEKWNPIMQAELEKSIMWFVLATATRWARGDEDKWSTMMVHTSSNIKPHEKTHKMISDYVQELAGTCESSQVLEKFESLWNEEIDIASGLEPDQVRSWKEARIHIGGVVSKIHVITDNSRSLDRLNYGSDVAPHPVIVVGGNTLARGLTLNGLVSSYFVRTSNAYDSLMQMGRWFGYRPRYADLQRIWMANDPPRKTAYWFRELSLVEEEIRQQIEIYAREGRSPSELGIKIKNLPGMAITAAAKMKSAMIAQIGFGSSRQQTILFRHEQEAQALNQSLLKKLVAEVGPENFLSNGEGGLVAQGLSSEVIMKFLSDYQMHPDTRTMQSDLVNKYIENLNSEGELNHWNVALYSNQKGSKYFDLGSDLKVKMANRSKMRGGSETINIKTLISLGDMVADKPSLKKVAKELVAEGKKVSETELRHAREHDPETKGVGLLGIYVIDKDSVPANFKPESSRVPLESALDLVGVYLIFPRTQSKFNVDYVSPNIKPEEVDFEDIDEIPEEDELDEELEIAGSTPADGVTK
jgi:hypothetical protein